MRRWAPWIVLIAILYFLWSGDGNPVEGFRNTLDQLQGRGFRVGHAPADSDGVVDDDPQALADAAGVDLNTYAGARNIASEEPHADRPTKIAIMWCLINEASRRGESIAAVLLRATNPDHDGYFGTQADLTKTVTGSDGKTHHPSDRYASTRTDPYTEELLISAGCQTGELADPTGGCQQYDRPKGENAARVAARRIAAGAELVTVPGVDAGLRFWRT